jgi:hypothetical protein
MAMRHAVRKPPRRVQGVAAVPARQGLSDRGRIRHGPCRIPDLAQTEAVPIRSPAAASSAPKARPGDPAVPQWSPAAADRRSQHPLAVRLTAVLRPYSRRLLDHDLDDEPPAR